MSRHYVLPDNTNHHISSSWQQLPLLFLGIEKAYQRLYINPKHLLVMTEQKGFPNSEISGELIKTPCLLLVHMQDWLDTVLFWLRYLKAGY